MEEVVKFTVFTPVYNRKNKINRVWDSLKGQTYRNFEWIVVDDGSTDGVWELLLKWKNEAKFPVTLLSQSNSGKHVAWNKAVQIATGDLFVPADSDDGFEPDTLERFAFHWETISHNERNNFSGINVLCKDSATGQIVGNPFPADGFVSNNLDLFFKYKVTGEKWGCIRTDVLRERPFKEVRGSYLSENYVWFYIARKYNVLCVNEALRNYYTESGACLSKPKPKDLLRSAESMYTSDMWNIRANFDYIVKYENLKVIVKRFVNMWRFAFLADLSVGRVLGDLSENYLVLISLLLMPPSYLFYLATFAKIKKVRCYD